MVVVVVFVPLWCWRWFSISVDGGIVMVVMVMVGNCIRKLWLRVLPCPSVKAWKAADAASPGSAFNHYHLDWLYWCLMACI